MDTHQPEIEELRQLLRDLTIRIFRIEKSLNLPPIVSGATVTPPPPLPSTLRSPAAPVPVPVAPLPLPPKAKSEPGPDLESRIGSHWLNRIGITAVLIGVAYFLKYAFDSGWIGPSGRVEIGLLAGIAVVLWSERFRSHGYKFFSYSLKAVGIGVMYLSLWAAFHLYSLFPSWVATAAMIAVTAATATMALTQNAEILAAFALIGGYATPVLLSTGQNRELELFSYVAVLNLATLVMLMFRSWQRLVTLSFIGTLVLYLGWYSEFYNRSQLRLTIGFATLFFAIFAVTPLLARQDEEQTPLRKAIPLLLALVNASTYFLQVYVMLSEINQQTAAWFALGLAAVYIFFSSQARARYTDLATTQNLKLLHLALAIGFITTAIPIRLGAHWITVGWFVEAAALLWVADRIKSELLNAFAVVALAMGVVRLLFFDDFYSTQLIFNARMATHALAIGVLAVVAWYASKRTDEKARWATTLSIIALNALAVIALSREVADYYSRQLANVRPQLGQWRLPTWTDYRAIEIARDFTYSALWMGYGAALMLVGFWRRSAFVRWQALILIAATVVKVFVYDTSQLDRAYRIVSFIALGVLLLAVSFVYQRDWLQLSRKKQSNASVPQS